MTHDLRLLVLVNPASGRGFAGRVYPQIAELLRAKGLHAEFVVVRTPQEMTQHAASAKKHGFGCVVVLGGDGAIHFVLRGLLGTGVPLSVIPVGTGNDIAMALGFPRDPFSAAESLLHADLRSMDVLRARFADGTTQHFIGAGGTGLDADANILANSRLKTLPGATRYVVAALWALKNARPLQMEVRYDDQRWNGLVLLAAVANIPSYGAGVIIAPEAVPDDGLFEVTLVGNLSLARIVEALPIVLRDGNLRWPEVTRLRARKLSLRADRAAGFHGDGELLGQIPVEIELLPRALDVLAPRRS